MSALQIGLKLAHILGAAVLFGTGLGIAFFMLMAHRTRDAAFVARTARVVVIADAVFTATAVIVQPVTGALLIWLLGYGWSEPWVVGSLVLYVFVGVCWLPVVVIQMKMRDLAATSAVSGAPLPEPYHRLFRVWFVLGWPAFAGVLALFVLMIAKPPLW